MSAPNYRHRITRRRPLTMAAAAAESGSRPGTATATASQKEANASQRDLARSEGGSSSSDEPEATLHAKTYLAVFAVCMIYFVQIYNVVGAGAVCCVLSAGRMSRRIPTTDPFSSSPTQSPSPSATASTRYGSPRPSPSAPPSSAPSSPKPPTTGAAAGSSSSRPSSAASAPSSWRGRPRCPWPSPASPSPP